MHELLRRVYRGRRVLVTGHTGFKGCWLTIWLESLGAKVTGLSLDPPSTPSLFGHVHHLLDIESVRGDVRDIEIVAGVIRRTAPEFVFHLAAQSLVRTSYEIPLDTITTNILGTTHVLEALRQEATPAGVVIVTSDKCYENRETLHAYSEADPLGGHDVYSMSKAACELVAASYRKSFFGSAASGSRVALATARAGNVIGGGDWGSDRLMPDIVTALGANRPVAVRHPDAIRPWQHVIEAIAGYLCLGAGLGGHLNASSDTFCEAWNFGPSPDGFHTVAKVVDKVIECWGGGSWTNERGPQVHEAKLLRLSIEKASARLPWAPCWNFDKTIERTVEWYRSFYASPDSREQLDLCRSQIRQYVAHAQVTPDLAR